MKGMIPTDAVVLDDGAVIPKGRLLSPPPDRFSHELTRAVPYDFGGEAAGEPAGDLPAGTKVLLVADDDGTRCHVVDGRGLYVRLEKAALRELRG
jgi:hypothetical protein